jgi:hypothetical protein
MDNEIVCYTMPDKLYNFTFNCAQVHERAKMFTTCKAGLGDGEFTMMRDDGIRAWRRIKGGSDYEEVKGGGERV